MTQLKARPYLPSAVVRRGVLCALVFFVASGWLSHAAEDKSAAPVPVEKWVERLSDDSYATREQATRFLWGIGEKALPYLAEAARGGDPERAKRARLLLRKIDLGISPDTSPEILALVSRYENSKGQDKVRALYKLRDKGALKQVLKLYALETDKTAMRSLRDVVEGVWVAAARPAIATGHLDAARALLELAPPDAQGMIALAEFRAAFGVPDSRSAGRFEQADGLWRVARQRVAGHYAEAARGAAETGDPLLAASMRLLDGDPLPWLERMSENVENARGEENRVCKTYALLAARHWSGEPFTETDLAPLRSLMTMNGNFFRLSALQSLALLGCSEDVDAAMRDYGGDEESLPLPFLHFESLERIPEALQALGLDPAKPDFGKLIDHKLEDIRHTVIDDSGFLLRDLAYLVSFLERRGFQDEVRRHFDPGFKEMAEKDPDSFLRLAFDLTVQPAENTPVPGPVLRCAAAYAGEDDAKWESLIKTVTGAGDVVDENVGCVWWRWLAELEPGTSRPARLESLFALLRFSPNQENLRARLLEKAWKVVDAAKPEDKPRLLRRLSMLAIASKDAVTGIRAAQPLRKSGVDLNVDLYLMFLSAAGDWKHCAEICLSLVAGSPAQPDLHAYAAVALRHLGREAEAVEQDRLARCLALGDAQACFDIATAYATGADTARAMMWWKKVLAESKPVMSFKSAWAQALVYYADASLRQGNWKEAAATGEAVAYLNLAAASNQSAADPKLPVFAYRRRLNADLPRAMLLLRTDKPKALAILGSCQQLLVSDGSLADQFFPALRAAGLRAEHDAWFDESWSRLAASIKAYPACDNTRNTAAWLGARALRRLDDAEAQSKEALKMNPTNAAYMDTMAELQFAKGDRKKALDWSDRSLLAEPFDVEIRGQNERFHTSSLPVR